MFRIASVECHSDAVQYNMMLHALLQWRIRNINRRLNAQKHPIPHPLRPLGRGMGCLNSLMLRQNECHFADDIFNHISLNENVWIPIKISLKFVPKGPINNIPALVQIMAWRRPGDKPLSEPMMIISPTHICVTRPQWVKGWGFWKKLTMI